MAPLSEETIRIRRALHAWPETGFTEFWTAGQVAAHLRDLGLEVLSGEQVMDPSARMGLPEQEMLDSTLEEALRAGLDPYWAEQFTGGMTALAVRIPGSGDGPHLGFRFDIDALPVTESEEAVHRPRAEGFASARPGFMHACGHDGHTAIGLALASKLVAAPPAGPVTLVFQSAEEGLRGARAVAQSGILDQVDQLYCLHLGLGLPTGRVYGATEGLLYSDKFRVEFKGRAAHAGMSPEAGANALLAAANATVAMHQLPPYAGPGARLNVGTLHAGVATNVVAEHAVMTFETRAPDTEAGERLSARALECLEAAAAPLGVTVEVSRAGGAPAVVCDPEAAARVELVIDQVEGLHCPGGPHRDSGSEDASWLLERVRDQGGQGTYIAFGCSSPAGHHESNFDLDERALPLAVSLLEGIVREAENESRSLFTPGI